MNLIENTPFPDIFCKPEEKNQIFQGDIIKYEDYISTKKPSLGFIILSNSCDLERLKDKKVINIAPIYSFNFVFDDMIKDAFNKTKNKKKESKSVKNPKKKINYINYFIELVSNFILEESNYKKKYTFFISPLPEFNNKSTIAHIEHVTSISIEYFNLILKSRITSIKSPWREKLGYKVGNLYNRIATYTPKFNDIKKWWVNTYNEIFEKKKRELEKL